VVLAIVGLLLGSAMYTLSARIDEQNRLDTRRKLEEAKELLIGFALVNGRLPCPARLCHDGAACTITGGDEVRLSTTGECKFTSAGAEDYWGGQLSDTTVGGFLPGRSIGYQPVDAAGFALDAWGNRIRYAVARSVLQSTSCPSPSAPPPLFPHWTSRENLKANGIACKPCDGSSPCYPTTAQLAITDLLICSGAVVASGTGIASTSCAANQGVTNQGVVAAVVFSTGKNGSIASTAGANELENVDGDNVFISKTPDPVGTATGEYDDILVWIPVGVLYGRMVSAGVLP